MTLDSSNRHTALPLTLWRIGSLSSDSALSCCSHIHIQLLLCIKPPIRRGSESFQLARNIPLLERPDRHTEHLGKILRFIGIHTYIIPYIPITFYILFNSCKLLLCDTSRILSSLSPRVRKSQLQLYRWAEQRFLEKVREVFGEFRGICPCVRELYTMKEKCYGRDSLYGKVGSYPGSG